MSRRYDEEYDGGAMAKCKAIGLSPKTFPMGDAHHTDIPFSNDDKALGEALAYFLGTLFADVECQGDGEGTVIPSRYWYYERTSIDEWSRVARALRIHGLRIENVPTGLPGSNDDGARNG